MITYLVYLNFNKKYIYKSPKNPLEVAISFAFHYKEGSATEIKMNDLRSFLRIKDVSKKLAKIRDLGG